MSERDLYSDCSVLICAPPAQKRRIVSAEHNIVLFVFIDIKRSDNVGKQQNHKDKKKKEKKNGKTKIL